MGFAEKALNLPKSIYKSLRLVALPFELKNAQRMMLELESIQPRTYRSLRTLSPDFTSLTRLPFVYSSCC